MAEAATVTACVLIIGNEILSGRTQDVNLAHIASELNEHGIQVREARVIPDVEDEIVTALNFAREKYDYVVTTGGIGPTHDDITADCVAKALSAPLYMHPELEALLRRREAPPEIMEVRLRMARVPTGAELIRPARACGFQGGKRMRTGWRAECHARDVGSTAAHAERRNASTLALSDGAGDGKPDRRAARWPAGRPS